MTYPEWICHDCAIVWCRGRTPGIATWHEDTCGVCQQTKLVTEPRDYGGMSAEWWQEQDK